jgi:hypothetical protein
MILLFGLNSISIDVWSNAKLFRFALVEGVGGRGGGVDLSGDVSSECCMRGVFI